MDDEAYERLVVNHGAGLAQLAYRLTGQRESARDLVQDVLLVAYRRWSRVSAADDPRAYLRRMLVNQHLNNVRRRIAEVPSERLPESPGPSGHQVVDDRDAVWRALATLSGRQRTVLVLRHYEALDDTAIAALLGCRRATVRSLAARGLAALRQSRHLNADRDSGSPRRLP